MNNEKRFLTRDFDIRIISKLYSLYKKKEDFLVLTGSYSIEALVNRQILNEDIDMNIFTKNIQKSILYTKDKINLTPIRYKLIKETDNYLEYSFSNEFGDRFLELNYIQYENITAEEHNLIFNFHNNNLLSKVPVTNSFLIDSKGKKHSVKVKSLPYAIATWALRISGQALNQKRKVRKSDIENFQLLIKQRYEKNDVLKAMLNHPQMPKLQSAEKILFYATSKKNNRK